jgi:hypothetical protein
MPAREEAGSEAQTLEGGGDAEEGGGGVVDWVVWCIGGGGDTGGAGDAGAGTDRGTVCGVKGERRRC